MFNRRAWVVGFLIVLVLGSFGCGGKGGSSSTSLSITSLSTTSATVGSSATALTVIGTGFTGSSVIEWGGTALPTTFVSATQLSTVIPAANLTATGTFNVTVKDGSKTSNSISFSVTASKPVISVLTPSSATAGTSDFVLNISGSGYDSSAVVKWNGTELTTVFVSATQLNATVPAGLIASSGAIPITVTTTGTNGGTSSEVTFAVNAPSPAINGINPAFVTAGSGDTVLTVTGTGFLANSVVQVAGTDHTTVQAGPNQLTTVVPASELTSAGNLSVAVNNPTPAGGLSNALTLAVSAASAPQAPVANAGHPRTVATGATVTLDGTASTATSGNPLSYTWSFISVPGGSAAALSNTTLAKPSFTPDVAGNYVLQLVVNDGTASAPATVTISTVNSAPVANAGTGSTVLLGQTVRLDATRSYDDDGNALSYSWTFTSVPSGSTATIATPNSPVASFVVDKSGTFVAQVTVSDGSLNSSARVTFSTSNSAPLATAGANQTVAAGKAAHLDASASTDADGDPLTYRWALLSAPAGSSAILSSTSGPTPSFTPDRAGIYVAQVIVNDGKSDGVPATVTISTTGCAPVADAGLNRTVTTGTAVVLNGSGSTDVDASRLNYRWALISKPAGSSATLSSFNTVRSGFTADAAGTYIAQLIVNDGTAESADTVTITTTNSIPSANAGVSQLVGTGEVVQLDGTHSTDSDGDPLTYHWALLSKPALSAAFLSSTNIPNPVFTADKAGYYVVQLVVSDGNSDSIPATVLISTTTAHPVAIAGNQQTVGVGVTAQLDGSESTNPNAGTLQYAWSILSSPAGSTAALTAATSATPTLTPDVAGDYIVQLITNDGTMTSVPATVIISTTSSAPIAKPDGVGSATVGTSVALSGAGSSSPDGHALTYKWSLLYRPTGSASALTSTTSATPNLTPDKRGIYVVQLVVNDGVSSSAPATFAIATVSQPPVADAGSNQTVTSGTTVTLSGSASSNPDGETLTYQWMFKSIPTGSTAKLTGTTTPTPSFVADQAGTYTVQLVVSDSQLSSAPATVTITADQNTQISFSSASLSVNSNVTTSVTVSIPSPAPSGGLTLNLTSSDTNIATVPATVKIDAGVRATTLQIQTKAVSGTATITASATGYTSGTMTVTVSARSMTMTSFTVGKDLQVSTAVTFDAVAPSGGIDVTLTSSDPSKVALSTSATSAGSGSIKVHANSGSLTTVTYYVQSLVASGSATITATATGYDDSTVTISTSPSGFVITSGSTINTTTLSADTPISVAAVALDPTTLKSTTVQALRGGMSQVSLQLNNSSTSVGTLTTNPIKFSANSSVLTGAFHPVAEGNTTITLPVPSGFSTPSELQSIDATVSTPLIKFTGDVIVGKDLQSALGVYLTTGAPTGGLTVTVTSSDPSKLLLSTSGTAAGSASVSVYISEGALGQPRIYAQALTSSGTVTLTATGDKFADGTATASMVPSGFVITTPNINTQVSAPDTPVRITTAKLDPVTLAYAASQPIRGGLSPVSVAAQSGNASVGTIVTSPVVFNPNVSEVDSAFHPVATGSTTLSLTPPAGFSTPSNYQSISATVTSGSLNTQTNVVTGKDLQTFSVVSLGTTPPAPVDVTITSNNSAVAVVSNSPTVTGGTSVTFTGITTTTPQFYIQGLSVGSTTLTIQASGFTPITVSVKVNPSGFVLGISDFAVATGSADVQVPVGPAVLDPTTLKFVSFQTLRPGVSAQVDLTSSSTSVGTISSPVALTENQASATATFHPVAKGSTTVTLGTPAGFSTPTNFGSLTATVQ